MSVCVYVCVCLHSEKKLWNRHVCGFLMTCVNHIKCSRSSPKGLEWGEWLALMMAGTTKKNCSACLRSLQRLLTLAGSCWEQKSTGLGQWQLEKFSKSGSNQLLIINTTSRVIWCFWNSCICASGLSTPQKTLLCPLQKREWTSLSFRLAYLGGTSGQLRFGVGRIWACGEM